MNNKNIRNLNSSDADHSVGYQKPPANTRFKPGQSGNPKGRPKQKEADVVKLLLRELKERVVIEENGKITKVTKREVLVKQILKKALMGDGKCMDFILRVEGMQANIPPETESVPESSGRIVSPIWKRFLREQKARKRS